MSNWFDYLRKGLSQSLPPDRIAGQQRYKSIKQNLKNLKPFIGRHLRKGIIGSILVLLSTLLTFPSPLITRYITDDVILAKKLPLLAGAIILLIVVNVLAKIFSALQDYYFARFEQEIVLDIQQDLLEHTLRLPKSFFDAKEIGYLMTRLSSDVQRLRWFFSSTLVYILSQTIRFIGGVIFLFILEWRITLIILVPIPILVFGMNYFAKKIHTLSHQSMEQEAIVSRQMQESLSATALIKAFSSEKRTSKQIIDKLKGSLQISLQQTTVNSLANFIMGLFPSLANAIAMAIGVILIINGRWTLGSLLAYQGYMSFVYNPAQFIASANLQLQNALAALERVSALYDIVPEENGTGNPVAKLSGEVEFKNVSFSYNPDEMIIEDISFHILPGEHIAVVGPSGVGKTTLISLLLRFYQPTQGKILFDEQEADIFEIHSLRERIGYVSQGNFLLSGSIIDNLRYGKLSATLEQVESACKSSGIHDFILTLPNGYNTIIGERGVNLSEGQRQRISIARALIKNPDIVILDEPASALDSIVEKSIFDSLPRVLIQKTMFVVAHRLATIRHSDKILLLNDKHLVAVGTHDELMNSNDFYRSLVINQQLSTEKPE